MRSAIRNGQRLNELETVDRRAAATLLNSFDVIAKLGPAAKSANATAAIEAINKVLADHPEKAKKQKAATA